ncbi:Gfo/Idh/MocA family protein [Gorillibacterium sp. sgz500922]|uniref:Gfo/Idh/MocA family protein n=1 Tax=Gorillibacterium sp. sgz500922 TaxID=3446694 RepID=UPI003F67F0EB
MGKKWKVLLVGMGDFGSTWLERVLLKHEGVGELAVVDRHADKRNKAMELAAGRQLAAYESLEDALAAGKPELLINVTQPHLHAELNRIAFEQGIPVLCEKPLAVDFEDALEASRLAEETGVPLMVAQNYRFLAVCREVRHLLAEGAIGKLHSVEIDFRRCHRMTNYHGEMEQPLLLDVTVHHMDLLRYFTSEEAETVYAAAWNPAWSWYRGLTNAHLELRLSGDIAASYRGSLTCRGEETDWRGRWRFEGERGTLAFADGELELRTSVGKRRWKVAQERDSRWALLDECLASLSENRPGETDARDNLYTARIIQGALDSIREDRLIRLDGRQAEG